MSPARSTLVLLALGAGCGGDLQSLDDAMGALIETVPASVTIAAEHTQICLAERACFASVHEHRLELTLVPVKPAMRHGLGDTMQTAGTFRLMRMELESEAVLVEGALSASEVVRQAGQGYTAFARLWLGAGTLVLTTQDFEHWDVASLTLTR